MLVHPAASELNTQPVQKSKNPLFIIALPCLPRVSCHPEFLASVAELTRPPGVSLSFTYFLPYCLLPLKNFTSLRLVLFFLFARNRLLHVADDATGVVRLAVFCFVDRSLTLSASKCLSPSVATISLPRDLVRRTSQRAYRFCNIALLVSAFCSVLSDLDATYLSCLYASPFFSLSFLFFSTALACVSSCMCMYIAVSSLSSAR